MKVVCEEKYRAQSNLKVYRIEIEDSDNKDKIKRLYETDYVTLLSEIEPIVPKTFEKQRVVIDLVDLGLNKIIISVWKIEND